MTPFGTDHLGKPDLGSVLGKTRTSFLDEYERIMVRSLYASTADTALTGLSVGALAITRSLCQVLWIPVVFAVRPRKRSFPAPWSTWYWWWCKGRLFRLQASSFCLRPASARSIWRRQNHVGRRLA